MAEALHYKELLIQTISDFGVSQEELAYWNFLLNGFDEEMSKKFYERLVKHPDIFMGLHHDLIRKCLYIKNGAPLHEADAILNEEKKVLSDLIKSED
ncbi:MAG: hypothetical protein V1898_00745 [Patescibacteria group bacterium]